MTNYLTLTEFVPGTKAKAEEVNANFSAVKTALNAKAESTGDNTKTFSVATATDDSHAVNKSQMDDLSDALTGKINGTSARFCVKSGNTTNGVGDLLTSSGMTLTAKVGGTYSNLIISDCNGKFTTISSIPALNLTGKADGTYNIFVKADSTMYALLNNIYKQPARPNLVEGDIWLNTSVEPIKAIKYTSAADADFSDVPVGQIKITSSNISSVLTFPFNQNGYDVNWQSQGYRFPDYSKMVSKTWNTTYTAECDGWIYASSSTNYLYDTRITINGNIFKNGGLSFSTDIFIVASLFLPVKKGDTWIASGGSSGQSVIFYPAKGAN